MDRCTGNFIIQLRAATLTMEASSQRMNFYRLGTIATCAASYGTLCPAAMEAFRAVAKIEKGIQEVTRGYWKEQKALWEFSLASRCDLFHRVRTGPFPEFDFPIVSGEWIDLASIKEAVFDTHTVERSLHMETRGLISTAKLERKHDDWTIRWIE